MGRKYTTPPDRFQPFKNIRVGIKSLEKKCTKCQKWRALNLDNYDRDYKRAFGHHSQCKICQGIYGMFYRRIYKGQVK